MRWLVVGGGISGQAACRLLAAEGREVTLCDDKPRSPAVLATADVLPRLRDWERIVLSPGVPLSHPLVQALRKQGRGWQSELELATARLEGRRYLVTGTNGKSTLCALLARGATASGAEVRLSGNIGTAASDIAREGDSKATQHVIEVSSYQAEHSQELKADGTVFLDFSPDHLQRHGTLEAYFRAKWRLIEQTRAGGAIVLSPRTQNLAERYGLGWPQRQVHIVEADPDWVARVRDRLDQPLIAEPVATAALVAEALFQRPRDEAVAALAGFEGLPFRLQVLRRKASDPWVINDSKATNVAATRYALEQVEGPVTLMLGGEGKGESFTPLCAHLERIRQVVAFGAAGEQIAGELAANLPVRTFPTLRQAMASVSQPLPHHLLFSPGCASFDEFANFEARGRAFQDLVYNWGYGLSSPGDQS